jgi:ferric iron reductase protein FhuF
MTDYEDMQIREHARAMERKMLENKEYEMKYNADKVIAVVHHASIIKASIIWAATTVIVVWLVV